MKEPGVEWSTKKPKQEVEWSMEEPKHGDKAEHGGASMPRGWNGMQRSPSWGWSKVQRSFNTQEERSTKEL